MRYLNKWHQNAAATALVAVALAVSACGKSSSSPGDSGGVDAPDAVDGGGMDLASLACDPAAQNCPAGSKCDFFCQGSSAVVDCQASSDGGAVGTACSTTTMQCARGTGCISMPSGGGPVCRKYCAGDGDCATGERCHNVTVGVTCSAGTTSFPLHFCY